AANGASSSARRLDRRNFRSILFPPTKKVRDHHKGNRTTDQQNQHARVCGSVFAIERRSRRSRRNGNIGRNWRTQAELHQIRKRSRGIHPERAGNSICVGRRIPLRSRFPTRGCDVLPQIVLHDLIKRVAREFAHVQLKLVIERAEARAIIGENCEAGGVLADRPALAGILQITRVVITRRPAARDVKTLEGCDRASPGLHESRRELPQPGHLYCSSKDSSNSSSSCSSPWSSS